MHESQFTETIGHRFHRPPVPTLVARTDLAAPIVFSHVSSGSAMPAPTLAPPLEDTFALHVHHRPITRGDMWQSGRHRAMPRVDDGGIFVFDLQGEPTAQIHEGFEFSRFHLPRSTMDDIAYERGLPRIGHLHADGGRPDAVVKHLALAMLQRALLHGEERDTLFADGLTLALFSHVARTYGGRNALLDTAGTFAPWQLRRLDDWVRVHLCEALSIADLAAVLDLSPSHFTRLFTRSLGVSPHRWVLRQRIACAKRLLAMSDLPLADIAAASGFFDQSHLTRVFARLERTTPGRWRRQAR